MAAFERATAGLFLWWSANAALVEDPDKLLVASRFDVIETADRIEADARSFGLSVRERVDHTAAAQRGGYRLPPTQSMLVETPSGLAPLRLVVWQARSGLTFVSLEGHSGARVLTPSSPLARLLRGLAQRPLERASA